MTAEDIEKYINQIAFSGAEEFLNKYKDNASSIIGHFGLGFYSCIHGGKKFRYVLSAIKRGQALFFGNVMGLLNTQWLQRKRPIVVLILFYT